MTNESLEPFRLTDRRARSMVSCCSWRVVVANVVVCAVVGGGSSVCVVVVVGLVCAVVAVAIGSVTTVPALVLLEPSSKTKRGSNNRESMDISRSYSGLFQSLLLRLGVAVVGCPNCNGGSVSVASCSSLI